MRKSERQNEAPLYFEDTSGDIIFLRVGALAVTVSFSCSPYCNVN